MYFAPFKNTVVSKKLKTNPGLSGSNVNPPDAQGINLF